MVSSRALVRLLAVVCGVTIANVYYAQPLLHTIAGDLGTSESDAGLVVTATQLGYAAGLVLVVPLGDILPRRSLLTTLLAVDAAALAASAASPGLPVLALLAVMVGCSSVVAQMVIPYAATIAPARERAQAIGLIMGALLLGILLSRTVAGLVASAGGWRTVYVAAAGLMTLLAVVASRVLPAGGREVRIGYAAQMRAVAHLALHQPVLRWRAVIGAAQFAAFSCFWTTVTFLLSGPAFHYSQAAIGLFALVGAAGAGCALAIGRPLDRHPRWRWPITGAGVALLLASFGPLAAGGSNVAWLIIGALLMDACSQAVHVTNQAVVYDLIDAARSRITTTYMTVYFLGGAAGTTLGATAYTHAGWNGACAAAAGFCGLAILGWAWTRRHERPRGTGQTAAETIRRHDDE
jgi:predicted MFS family arabinose efflux permease